MGTDFELMHLQLMQLSGFRGPFLPTNGMFGISQKFDMGKFHEKRTRDLTQYLKDLQNSPSRETKEILADFLIPDDGQRIMSWNILASHLSGDPARSGAAQQMSICTPSNNRRVYCGADPGSFSQTEVELGDLGTPLL